ncbi:MAG: transaldolase [Solirubrobacterales bacterium]|nr:transaldolase [Solirubrobacterales bacterium]
MTPLHTLLEHHQSPWIDYVSRPFLRDGELRDLIDAGIVGVTSNPTIFQGAISDGDAYDEQLREVLRKQEDPKEVFLALAREDIREACDQFREVFDRGESTRDGWVSLEVDPNLAFDAQATTTEARRLHQMIDRPNLFVKIPGTEPGLEAIEETIASGIPVNVTLLFSLQRHREAAEAYLRGLRRLRDGGGDLRSVASVASFFVSRVDTEADRRLDELGGHDQLKGKLAIANAKLAYQTYKELFSGSEWEELEAEGASPQRCLWASTSTKNPDYRDVVYVEELIGPQTVNTMPRETVEAFQDHGRVEDTLERDLDEAHRTLERFEQAGIDYDDVVRVLEREGVEKFADSFKQLLEGVAEKRDQLVAA